MTDCRVINFLRQGPFSEPNNPFTSDAHLRRACERSGRIRESDSTTLRMLPLRE